MCGRFTLAAPGEALADEFELEETPELVPRYNIAPTQPVLVLRARPTGRRAETMKWGIAYPPSQGRRPPLLINARAETLGERPAWKDALWRRRCLIPADGFYEWKDEDGRRQPYYIARRDGRPLALAGLWQPRFTPEGETSCTIVTTRPLPPVAAIHDRMPVVLDPAARSVWLDEEAEREAVVRLLLTPALPYEMAVHPVGTLVNSAAHDEPACREPLAAPPPPRQGRLFG